MRKVLFVAAIAAVAAVAQGVRAATPPMSDQDFVDALYQANQTEIREARIAVQYSKNPAIVDFAKTMIMDHSTANVELSAAARQAGLRSTEPMIPAQNNPDIVSLMAAEGQPGFGRAYLSMQITAHEQAVALVRGEAQNGTAAPVKTYASNLLPTVRQHLDSANMILAGLPATPGMMRAGAGSAGTAGGQINGQSGTQPLSGTPPISPANPNASPGASPVATQPAGAVPAPTNTPNH